MLLYRKRKVCFSGCGPPRREQTSLYCPGKPANQLFRHYHLHRESSMSVINTNSLSLIAQGNLQKSQSALGSAIERLSSGLRINSAKDDAAGHAIANRFPANLHRLTQATQLGSTACGERVGRYVQIPVV